MCFIFAFTDSIRIMDSIPIASEKSCSTYFCMYHVQPYGRHCRLVYYDEWIMGDLVLPLCLFSTWDMLWSGLRYVEESVLVA